MSHDTQTAPIAASTAITPSSRVRLIARIFGQVADTTEWPYEKWQALMARLIAGSPAVLDMTMGEVAVAIEATEQQFQVVR
jgi:hypothetical protein